MSSDEDSISGCPKKWQKIKMSTYIENNDSELIQARETGQPSNAFNLSEEINEEVVNTNDSNSNDSDDDFNIAVRIKKLPRPLDDSDNELLSGETSEKNKVINGNKDKDKDWDSDCSDGQSEKCPICLRRFLGQDIGSPESCDHSFCLDCLLEWAKKVNTCPIDRLPFMLILIRQKLEGKIIHRIPFNSWKSTDTWLEHDDDNDLTYCELCGQSDREDRLLLCDSCDLGYHCECLDPPLEDVPVGEWFCPNCGIDEWQENTLAEDLVAEFREMLRSRFRPGSSVFRHRLIARTSAIETVRNRVQRRREAHLDGVRRSSSCIRQRNKNHISKLDRRKKNQVEMLPEFHVRDRRMQQIINDESSLITPVTKRRFAHRLGLQRTTQSILQNTGLSYSSLISIGNEPYQDKDDASYDSSSDDDNYTSEVYQRGISYNNSRQSSVPSVHSPNITRSAPVQRIKVPSPQPIQGNVDILSDILQTQSILHSTSENVSIERDGSLVLKSPGSTQQRPQNPHEQSSSNDKSRSLPSTHSSSYKTSSSESRINQWYGSYPTNTDMLSGSHSGNHYDDQNSGHYGSSLCKDGKKRDHHHSVHNKETKTQSEDEVDIYSDIESVGDEIIEEESDIINTDQCNLTNVYRCDLQLDAVEQESDSSENELVIDEDAKVEEEDNHGKEWSEENNICSAENSPIEDSSLNSFFLQEENKQDIMVSENSENNMDECETVESNSTPEQSISKSKPFSEIPNSENYEEITCDDDETSENDDETMNNTEHDDASTESEYEQISKLDVNKNIFPINDLQVDKIDMEINSSPQNNTFLCNDQISSQLEIRQNQIISDENKSNESSNYNDENDNDCFDLKQDVNILNMIDNQSSSKTDVEVYSNITEENSIFSSPPNDEQNMNVEDENETQNSDSKSITAENEIPFSFREEGIDYENTEQIAGIDDFECLSAKEISREQNNEESKINNVSEIIEPHYSIMPAEDVEDISEAGSDDTKFKNSSEDWEVCDNRLEDVISPQEIANREVDDVEERVAKLFENEDVYEENELKSTNLSNENVIRSIKGHIQTTKSHVLDDEREEGEIIDDVPPVYHKSRHHKNRRQIANEDEIEDYGDHAPRANISSLPRIPKIKKDKTKNEMPQETVSEFKRVSVLSRIDIGSVNEISWKKLSRNTRERSYRDGRPKDNKLLFRERDIKQKLKKDDRTKKDEENKRKEEKYKRSEHDKWKEKSDHERLKDRNERQKESFRDKIEKEWKADKFHDKSKDTKEKIYDKSHRDEKNYRDKYKHKHCKDNKDHRNEKDKSQEKEKYVHCHHTHERDHMKIKDKKIKSVETKAKVTVEKKDIKREKVEKIPERKGTKYEKKHRDDDHHRYEHRKKDLPYSEVTAIESKEVYAKGDSIIINVNFNRNSRKEISADALKNLQKDIKPARLKEKFLTEQIRNEKEVKYAKAKHSTNFSEIGNIKHSPVDRYESKKKLAERMQVGEILWQETEEMQQDQEINDQANDNSDNDNDTYNNEMIDNFENSNSPESEVSEQILEKTQESHSKISLSPYNNEMNVPTSPVSCDSLKRSPPSPPSPTENDSYDPCDPTGSPFLQKDDLPEENLHISIDDKPKPPPPPELPPLPLEPEPSENRSPLQESDLKLNLLLEKSSILDFKKSDLIPCKTTSTSSPTICPPQPSHFSLPNVNIPPPNFIPQLVPNNQVSNIQSFLPNTSNWNAGSSHSLFSSQSIAQGNFVSPNLSQGTITAGTPQMSPTVPAPIGGIAQTHLHPSGQSMTLMPPIPNIRLQPPPIPVNLSSVQSFAINQITSTNIQSAANVTLNIINKSTPDVTEVIDMEMESPYSSGESPLPSDDKHISQTQVTSFNNDKFDTLMLSGLKTHSQTRASPAEKRHRESTKLLDEKVKKTQLLSKSIISVLDKMNKQMMLSSAMKCSKMESKSFGAIKNKSKSKSNTTKSCVPSKKESRSSEKKEVNVRIDESQLTVLDDLPSSAVEMQVKEKFLKKLNRQERVVEEVKLALKPYYSRREIDKEEYKEIMRKSVPKVCHNRSGDINPLKIKFLIEGYIKKFKHHRKKMEKLQKAKIS